MIDRNVHLFECDGPGCDAYGTVSSTELWARGKNAPPEAHAPAGWHVLILAGPPDEDRARVMCSGTCLRDFVVEMT